MSVGMKNCDNQETYAKLWSACYTYAVWEWKFKTYTNLFIKFGCSTCKHISLNNLKMKFKQFLSRKFIRLTFFANWQILQINVDLVSSKRITTHLMFISDTPSLFIERCRSFVPNYTLSMSKSMQLKYRFGTAVEKLCKEKYTQNRVTTSHNLIADVLIVQLKEI